MMGSDQQYCLKWNNHRSTILSVFDTLLEEESLVDVTLSAEGQFLRAHRVILSACSPYFRTLFRSSFLSDKAPVVVLKDVDFENLKALVEYMYKGEANVPQHMLQSFIRTAESLQIRGLAEGGPKHFDSTEPNMPPPHAPPHLPMFPQTPPTSTPFKGKGPGGILAARLAQERGLLDFEAMLPRGHSSPQKRARKSESKSSEGKKSTGPKGIKPNTSLPLSQIFSNNNYEEEGVLKIDEDADGGKENRNKSSSSPPKVDDDIVDLEASNGVDSDDEEEEEEQEEPSMPAPHHAGRQQQHPMPEFSAASGLINPWTGEDMSAVISDDHDHGSNQGDGLIFPPLDPNHSPFVNRSPTESTSSSRDTSAQDTPNRDPATNKYSCSRCGRSYLHQATLVRHQRYECGISASYPCSLCGRKFKRRDVLKGHMEKCVNKAAAAAAAASVSPDAVAAAMQTFPTTLSS